MDADVNKITDHKRRKVKKCKRWYLKNQNFLCKQGYAARNTTCTSWVANSSNLEIVSHHTTIKKETWILLFSLHLMREKLISSRGVITFRVRDARKLLKDTWRLHRLLVEVCPGISCWKWILCRYVFLYFYLLECSASDEHTLGKKTFGWYTCWNLMFSW